MGTKVKGRGRGTYYLRGGKRAKRNTKSDKKRPATHKAPRGRPYEGDRKTVKPNDTVTVRGYTRTVKIKGKKRKIDVPEHERKIYRKKNKIIIR